MINYTPFGFSDWQTEVSQDQGVRLGGQEDRGGLDHQRRRQRAVLQGARQPGHQGDRHSGRGLLGRRRGARRSRHQAARRPSRGLELLRSRSRRRRTRRSSRTGTLHQKPEAHHQRSDGSALYRLQHVGEGGGEGRHHRSGQGDRRAARHGDAESDRRHRRSAAEPSHHQAGLYRRGPGRRPVRRGLEDAGWFRARPGRRTCRDPRT